MLEIIAMLFGLASGGALALVGFKHGLMPWSSMLFKEDRDKLGETLDSTDKKLLGASLGSFTLCMVFLALSF